MAKSKEMTRQVAEELSLPLTKVMAAAKLFEEGNTIPFIARYRKEATGSLDEVELRSIQERLSYLQELETRKETILASIESQGKLTDDLRVKIQSCSVKHELEDLYLPFKPKRRTRAAMARERGLEPLAQQILAQPLKGDPGKEAGAFVSEEKGVIDIDAALAGACNIVAEIIAETAAVRSTVRQAFTDSGVLTSKVKKDYLGGPSKFEQYYSFSERIATIPSHRYLAIRRGEREGVLDFSLDIPKEPLIPLLQTIFKLNPKSPFAPYLSQALEDAYDRLILPSVETDVLVDLKLQSDRGAVDIFAQNLRYLLLSSPLGERSVVGIDPGLRTGCKCAAVDSTGKFLNHITIYPTGGAHAAEEAAKSLIGFIQRYCPFAIAIGNGTASRETEQFVKNTLSAYNVADLIVVQVSEAGASVYSASDIAREEFPDLDLTIRGAISIARRLQDPLAELVKIDPKAIGVGQYQHDVHQPLLHDKLQDVVESCVNYVGVELNTASAALLSYVAGIGPVLAKKIVSHRNSQGAFRSRFELLDVPGLGMRTFQQAAGFLRVRGGKHPLDSSAVHPERYELVEAMAQSLGIPLVGLLSNHSLIDRIDIKYFINESVGEPTLYDIISELKKPGRDPRAEFERALFREDVKTLGDLHVGMALEGIVTNVTAFGVFVDIGVHQDGLVHISQLTDRFIKDPGEVTQPGSKIKVRVLEVDVARKRISLTAKLGQGKVSPVKEKGKSKEKFNSNPFNALDAKNWAMSSDNKSEQRSGP